jgi:hypothetical protein
VFGLSMTDKVDSFGGFGSTAHESVMVREDDLHGRGSSTCSYTAYCAKGAEHLR